MPFDDRLRSSREHTLFRIGVAFSGLCWLAVAVSIVGAIYGALILAFLLMAHALFLAHVRGNGVRISERQLPALHARIEAAATRLGVSEVPEAYLVQSGGVLNAFATKLLSRNFIILNSALVDACESAPQLDFVIGHELGHLAAGHLKWNAFLAPFFAVPWLGAAYSRAREYTCDRAGYSVAGELEGSLRGLAVLAAGGKLAAHVDLAAFMEQREETGQFWMAILELVSTHPYLCKRAAAVHEFAEPGSTRPVPRHVAAYPLAPWLGIAAGPSSALLVVAMIGMLAAIAIPNFVKYQEKARQAQARTQRSAAQPDAVESGLVPEPDAQAPAGAAAKE